MNNQFFDQRVFLKILYMMAIITSLKFVTFDETIRCLIME